MARAPAPPSEHATVPLLLWNCHRLDVRTNNGVEGWHHRFSRRVRISHPNTWNLIEDIAKEHRHSRLLYSHVEAGQRIVLGSVRYNRINSRIRDHEEERQAGQHQTLDFLTRVGHLLR